MEIPNDQLDLDSHTPIVASCWHRFEEARSSYALATRDQHSDGDVAVVGCHSRNDHGLTAIGNGQGFTTARLSKADAAPCSP